MHFMGIRELAPPLHLRLVVPLALNDQLTQQPPMPIAWPWVGPSSTPSRTCWRNNTLWNNAHRMSITRRVHRISQRSFGEDPVHKRGH